MAEEETNQIQEGESETSSIFDERSFIRVSTAPARPLTDLQEFKRSTEFMLLEQAILCSTQLIQQNYQKYDLDSSEGQQICQQYLSIIEKLNQAFAANSASREYRNEFSKAYQILYKENTLCYLTEILDSAQEGFPYLWVNAQKYVFSPEVLEAGSKLLASFFRMQHVMRNAYGRVCQENVNISASIIQQQIMASLEDFDFSWAKFEQLMLIETDARRHIAKAIQIENQLMSIEIREKIKGQLFLVSQEYNMLRKRMCQIISQINSVANIEGKGRDDMGYEILVEAEGLLRRVTKEQSQAIRTTAQSIRSSFMKLRLLFRKYEQNIEMVDPQLQNNSDLVQALAEYQMSWEKGKNYFLEPNQCIYLKHFSHIIEATAEKYKEFTESIECRDADIFINIPCLMILKMLENQDQNICQYFYPDLEDEKSKVYPMAVNLQSEFEQWRAEHKQSYQYYNLLEKNILGINLLEHEQVLLKENEKVIHDMIQVIQQLSINMQRHNPLQWNSFMDAALVSSD